MVQRCTWRYSEIEKPYISTGFQDGLTFFYTLYYAWKLIQVPPSAPAAELSCMTALFSLFPDFWPVVIVLLQLSECNRESLVAPNVEPAGEICVPRLAVIVVLLHCWDFLLLHRFSRPRRLRTAMDYSEQYKLKLFDKWVDIIPIMGYTIIEKTLYGRRAHWNIWKLHRRRNNGAFQTAEFVFYASKEKSRVLFRKDAPIWYRAMR